MSSSRSKKPVKAGPPVVLSEDQKADIREGFELFDVDETGEISLADLMVTMRAMGFEPSKTELQRMVVAVGADPQATHVDFDMFQKVMTNKMEEVSTDAETMQAFRMFEPSTMGPDGPTIVIEDLQRISAMIGENNSMEELQEMVAEADTTGSSQINLEEFIRITNLRAAQQ